MKRPLRILVADDDAALRRLLEAALIHFGHAVVSCADGAAALRKSETETFDLFLLDFRLGTPDGVEVLAALRARGLTTPVIVMSSHFPDDVAAGIRQVPGTGMLSKPFPLDALKREIARFL